MCHLGVTMPDILTRLRAYAAHLRLSGSDLTADRFDEAAAEITALRAENMRLLAWLDWISVDDGDAKAALDGKFPPPAAMERVVARTALAQQPEETP